jgi:hypothetical protein
MTIMDGKREVHEVITSTISFFSKPQGPLLDIYLYFKNIDRF